MVLKFQNGAAVVPLRELRVTESSESVLAGTKRPPFRLVVRAIKPDGRRLNIRPAVSEEFVVRAVSSLVRFRMRVSVGGGLGLGSHQREVSDSPTPTESATLLQTVPAKGAVFSSSFCMVLVCHVHAIPCTQSESKGMTHALCTIF